MNQKIRDALLSYVCDLIDLKIWENNKALIFSNCDMSNYIRDPEIYGLLKNEKYELLLSTLQSYEEALIHHDWLIQEKIEGLNISKAYLFLEEIKNILKEDIDDDKIEEELITRYKIIENQN